jgi:hypothetical protein
MYTHTCMYWRVDYVRAVVADWPVTNKYHTSGIVISGPTEVPSAGQSRIEQCIIDLEVNRQSGQWEDPPHQMGKFVSETPSNNLSLPQASSLPEGARWFRPLSYFTPCPNLQLFFSCIQRLKSPPILISADPAPHLSVSGIKIFLRQHHSHVRQVWQPTTRKQLTGFSWS